MSFRRNILLLSAGRRVSLARALRAVANYNGALFFTADLQPELSAACSENKLSFRLPHVLEPDYQDVLHALCEQHEIGLVIPTIDTELNVLADLRESFLAMGTAIIVCDPELISIAHDKRRTSEFFDAFGVISPELYSPESFNFPAIAKPYDGSMSKDVYVLHKPEDFTRKVRYLQNLMITEYIDPLTHDEFTCDAYYDRFGSLRCVVPRLRIEVRGGEVAKSRTQKNNIVELFWNNLKYISGARGCLTFQFFRNRENGDLYLVELNARFGGGFPLSNAAGAHYPLWLFEEWIMGNTIEDFGGWQDDLTMLRYDDAVFLPGKP